MNDTSPMAGKVFNEMMRKKSGVEKMLMGASMFDSARAISRAVILEKNPDLPPDKLRVELFLSWYKEDFDEESRKKILDALS